MQSVSSRIWTCVAVSISYDVNHYTTGIFDRLIFYLLLLLNVPYVNYILIICLLQLT